MNGFLAPDRALAASWHVEEREGADVVRVDAGAEAERRSAVAERPSCLEFPHTAFAEEVESACVWVESAHARFGVADVQAGDRVPAQTARGHLRP